MQAVGVSGKSYGHCDRMTNQKLKLLACEAKTGATTVLWPEDIAASQLPACPTGGAHTWNTQKLLIPLAGSLMARGDLDHDQIPWDLDLPARCQVPAYT